MRDHIFSVVLQTRLLTGALPLSSACGIKNFTSELLAFHALTSAMTDDEIKEYAVMACGASAAPAPRPPDPGKDPGKGEPGKDPVLPPKPPEDKEDLSACAETIKSSCRPDFTMGLGLGIQIMQAMCPTLPDQKSKLFCQAVLKIYQLVYAICSRGDGKVSAEEANNVCAACRELRTAYQGLDSQTAIPDELVDLVSRDEIRDIAECCGVTIDVIDDGGQDEPAPVDPALPPLPGVPLPNPGSLPSLPGGVNPTDYMPGDFDEYGQPPMLGRPVSPYDIGEENNIGLGEPGYYDESDPDYGYGFTQESDAYDTSTWLEP